MKYPTTEYTKLKNSVQLAKKIAWRVPKFGSTRDLDIIKIRSLILLSHAAIEEYIENISISVADHCLTEYKNNKTITKPLFSLTTYYDQNEEFLHNYSLGNKKFDESFLNAVETSVEKHKISLQRIHGIKKKDQKKVLLPIALDLYKLDSTLSNTLESFGVKRGSVAHDFQITQIYPRAQIENDIKTIVRMLRKLDRSACRSTKTIM